MISKHNNGCGIVADAQFEGGLANLATPPGNLIYQGARSLAHRAEKARAGITAMNDVRVHGWG